MTTTNLDHLPIKHVKPSSGWVLHSAVVSIIILSGGLYYFRRMEKTFADII